MTEKFDLIIHGNIVLPDKVLQNGFVAVKNEKILEIYTENKDYAADKTINAINKLVLPGVVDAHTHCFSSPEEGFINASRSAVAGGVTTIVEMPYDADGMICSEEALLKKTDRIKSESFADVAALATLRNNEDALNDIMNLAKLGICGFKLSMFNTDPIRFPGIEEGLLLEMFYEIAKTGLPVGVHAENNSIISHYQKKYKNRGVNNPIAHCKSRPKAAEGVAVATALELARHSGVKLHIYHVSYPELFDLIDYYKKNNVFVTAETCPHYLALNSSDMIKLDAKGKINPPLREKSDSEGLWTAVKNGKVDMITSDHAPWTMDRKNNPDIFKNASGAPGVETILPLVYSEGVEKGRISILNLVKTLCETPAEIFGMGNKKGKIEKGYDADFVIIDPSEKYVINKEQLHSTAVWSPYEGINITGKVQQTVLRGEIVFENGIIKDLTKGNFVFINTK